MKYTSLIRGLALALVLVMSTSDVFASLINWEKHNEWRRKKLQETVAQVDLEGSSQILILFIRQYDANSDGKIDETEVKAIKKFLEDAPKSDAKPA